MQGYPGSKATDQYLAQRIDAASPEQMTAILLEGGQKFLNLVLVAMSNNDFAGKARHVNRVSEFILELSLRLNRADGGELVENLDRIYRWWTDELVDAARKNEPERLRQIMKHMGELHDTWEECHRKRVAQHQPMAPTVSLDLMVG